MVFFSFCYLEQFWLTMRTVYQDKKFGVDDQVTANRALDKMEVKWKQFDNKYYQGSTSGNVSLTITTLPHSVVCRFSCNNKLLMHYYAWHQFDRRKNKGVSKKTLLSEDHVWVLKDNWNASLWDTTLIYKNWLLNITKPNNK